MSKRKRDRKSVAGTAAAADGGREPGRFSARRKTETILRLLRGELLDSVARELGVTAATPSAVAGAVPGGRPGRPEESAGRPEDQEEGLLSRFSQHQVLDRVERELAPLPRVG